MHFLGHHFVVSSNLLSFELVFDVTAIPFRVCGMFELEGFVDDVVVGEEEEL